MLNYNERPTTEPPLTVLCRNLYLGADFNELFTNQARPSLVQIITRFYRLVQDTRYGERARAFAAEIDQRRPHVVCLQEVFRYQIGPEGHLLDLDFLAILLRELKALGADYRAASIAAATRVSLPILWQDKTEDLHILDRDVILVRGDVDSRDNHAARFTARMPPLWVPNERREPDDRRPLDIFRTYGWIWVAHRGQRIQVINTHLESISHAIQLAQARELLAAIGSTPSPVVVVGDLNTEPDEATYKAFAEAGFEDPFADRGRIKTFGAGADLRDDPLCLRLRIDHILTRGFQKDGPVEAFGGNAEERTVPSKLWPSDHLGLMAQLVLRPDSAA